MYTLLIVDDEYMTRRGIQKQMDLVGLGITRIFEAEDGIAAIELAKIEKPDIVISDIKMPRMDGVAFAFELKKYLPQCRVIFMSAYTELDYYRSAIKLNAVSYIEKPLDLDELKAALLNAIRDLVQFSKARKMSQQLSDMVEGHQELLKSQWSAMLIEQTLQYDEIKEKAELLQIEEWSSAIFAVMTIRQYVKDQLAPTQQIEARKHYAQCFEQYLKPLPIEGYWHFKGTTIILILMAKEQHRFHLGRERLMQMGSDLQQQLSDTTPTAIGIGTTVSAIKRVRASYEDSVLALERLFFKSGRAVDFFQQSKSERVYGYDKDKLTTFTQLMVQGEKMKSLIWIKHMTQEIRDCVDTPVTFVKDIYLQILQLLEGYKGESVDQGFGREVAWERVSGMMTLNELESYVIDKVKNYFELLEKQGEVSSVTLRIKQYISRKFADSTLSVDGMSLDLELSTSYLCGVFKKETGMTISKYLTLYRIEQAKLYMKQPQYKIEEIANLVGYHDADYFSKVFKKQVLCTPSEYRKKYII